MRNNYRFVSCRCCDNCAYSEIFDYGELRCYRHPAAHKNDARRITGSGVCDDHEYNSEAGTLITENVPIGDPNHADYTCEIKVKQ